MVSKEYALVNEGLADYCVTHTHTHAPKVLTVPESPCLTIKARYGEKKVPEGHDRADDPDPSGAPTNDAPLSLTMPKPFKLLVSENARARTSRLRGTSSNSHAHALQSTLRSAARPKSAKAQAPTPGAEGYCHCVCARTCAQMG